MTPSQIFIFLFVITCASIADRFVPLLLPLLLNDVLHVPTANQGLLSGALGTAQYAGFLICISIAGAVADRIGRRIVLVIALSGFGVLMLAYPLVTATWALFVVRFLWGVFFTGWTAGGATKMMDYPDNKSRGKFISLMIVVQNAIGVVFLYTVASHLHGWLTGLHMSMTEVARLAFWLTAVLPIAGAVAAYFFLAKDRVPLAPATDAKPAKSGPIYLSLLAQLRDVFINARLNPKFGLALFIGLVIRTETSIMQLFMPLWVVNEGRALGIDSATSTKTAALLLAILLVAQLVTPPIFGVIADRTDRLKMLVISLFFTGVAWSAFGLVHNVFSVWMIVAISVAGLCQGAQNIAIQTCLAQEAPAHLRGSSQGILTFLGTLSILVINMAGGRLFDVAGHSAPFVMEGVLCLIFFVIALVVMTRQNRAAAASTD